MALSGRHLHIQFKCQHGQVISTLGELKRKIWFARAETGFANKLWSGGRKIIPVKTRGHHLATFRYILKHRDEGAWVWSFRDGTP